MAWVWRGVAAVAALGVLLGVSVVVATVPEYRASSAAGAENVVETPASTPQPTEPGYQPGPLIPTLPPEEVPIGVIPVDRRLKAVFLGDSITRGMTEPASGEVGDRSWFYGLIDDSTGVLSYVATIAENGMTSDWMATQGWNAVEYSPDIVVVHGGTNDVSGEVDPAQVVANLEKIRTVVMSVGIKMAVCTLPPRQDPAQEARAVAVNEAIRAWAARSGVILLDTAAPLRAPGGGWNPGMTEDGLHPTAEAAALMSREAAKVLRTIPLGV